MAPWDDPADEIVIPEGILIKLNKEQHLRAFDVGLRRQWAHRDDSGERIGTKHKGAKTQNEFLADVAGASAELAVSIYYGTEWNDVVWDLKNHSSHSKDADVAPHFQVRRTTSDMGPLRLYASDRYGKAKVAVLTYVDYPECRLVTIRGAYSIRKAFANPSLLDSYGNVVIPLDMLEEPSKYSADNNFGQRLVLD